MNNTRGSTPPNPISDLPNRSTNLRKTLGIVGTPHGESIDKILSTKTCQIKMNRRNPAKNSSNLRTPKTPKSSLFAHGFGRGIKGKITTKGSCIHPHQIPKRKVLKSLQENRQERASKITKKNGWEQHIQALRNHIESSIHHIEVHTRSSCRPIILPSHKFSPRRSQAIPVEILGKIGKPNELGFQSWLQSSHLLGYMQATESLKHPY
jgi:hypothetical protein